jgi:hypothetical protein
VVTGTNMFSRSIGSAVGAAVFGAVANATLTHRLQRPPAALAGHLPSTVDAAGGLLVHPDWSAQEVEFVRSALFGAAHNVFLGLIAAAVLALGAVLLMPRQTRPLTFADADPPGLTQPP